MARAKRHYIPGHIWHMTHRCHKGEFLFKFSNDRQRWVQCLYEARRRYGLTILNYKVTSNHIHLLVVDDGDRDMIPRSIQLVAGLTGQEYNQRKIRWGAFWEDRYHVPDMIGESKSPLRTEPFHMGVMKHLGLWDINPPYFWRVKARPLPKATVSPKVWRNHNIL